MTKKKSMFYAYGTILIVIILGIFILNTKAEVKNTENNTNENTQKIVIGMKNYNYYPNTITVKAGEQVSIYLDKTVIGCFRDFTIREFGIHEYLRTPEDSIEFTPTKKGTYTFACSMGMGTGTLIVE